MSSTLAVRLKLRSMAAILLCVAFAGEGLAQQSGSRFLASGTFMDTATASMTFTVPSLLVNDPNNPPVTTLLLEFGQDGSAMPATPGLGSGVTFTLKLGGQNALPPFAITALPNGQTVLNNSKQITMSQPSPLPGPGLFKLDIVHLQGSQAAESWELSITGLPTNLTPRLRAIAALAGPNSGFTAMTPTGPCTGGSQPCPPPGCPVGQSCQPFTVFPWWREVAIYVVDLKWPIPPEPGPCLSCPIPWRGPVRDGFERVLVTVTPTGKDGRPLGPGRVGEVALNIRGGQAIGEVLDAGGGQYVQLIEFRKGQPPTVSATAGGMTSEEMVAGPGTAGVAPIYRTLTYVFGLIALLALAAFGFTRSRAGVNRG